jgi:hypothetical protein
MIFIDNKYTKCYYNIINNAKSKISNDGYTEKHHIIPKSLGGSNDKENIVKLTAREHFVCHLLLVKMTNGILHQKMLYAYTIMSGRKLYNSKNYKLFKEEYAIINSILRSGKGNGMYGADRSGEKNTFFGKNHTKETKLQLSKSQKQRKIDKPESFNPGVPKSQKHKDNVSKSQIKRHRDNSVSYNWNHREYGNFIGTVYDLKDSYPSLDIRPSEINKVLTGVYKSHRGWSFFI